MSTFESQSNLNLLKIKTHPSRRKLISTINNRGESKNEKLIKSIILKVTKKSNKYMSIIKKVSFKAANFTLEFFCYPFTRTVLSVLEGPGNLVKIRTTEAFAGQDPRLSPGRFRPVPL